MSERLQEIYVHLVWSTWDRAPALTADVHALGCPWTVVEGVEDRVYMPCAMAAAHIDKQRG